MEMKHSRTERGFGRVDFEDQYGIGCSIQESSAIDFALEDAEPGSSYLWLGCDFIHGEMARMHLNRKQVKKLCAYMQNWLKTGRLQKNRSARS